jgi:hypothetical protein
MICLNDRKKRALPILLISLLMISGCGIASSYRPAPQKTIRDFAAGDTYRKTIGVLVLTNATVFTSDQITAPFMDAFLAGLKSAAPAAKVVLPSAAADFSFLLDPPRIDNGDIDAFSLAGQARQTGMNAVVSPIIMDIRTNKKDTGFWFFREVSWILQIQTAATVYDTITGSRLALGILTEKIDISEQQAATIKGGQETKIDDLVELAKAMGDQLGEQMGNAVRESRWMASLVSVENGNCGIPAGSEVGVKPGDRFSVLDASGILTGLNGQQFIVPGEKIDEITIGRVTEQQAFGTPNSGSPPPVGSILVPGP